MFISLSLERNGDRVDITLMVTPYPDLTMTRRVCCPIIPALETLRP